jgi:hypothetical protein
VYCVYGEISLNMGVVSIRSFWITEQPSTVDGVAVEHGGWCSGGVRRWWSFFELSQSFELFNKVESGGGGAFLSFHRALSFLTRWSPAVVELF